MMLLRLILVLCFASFASAGSATPLDNRDHLPFKGQFPDPEVEAYTVEALNPILERAWLEKRLIAYPMCTMEGCFWALINTRCESVIAVETAWRIEAVSEDVEISRELYSLVQNHNAKLFISGFVNPEWNCKPLQDPDLQ